MARIKNYIKDINITNDDLLVGSSYEGQGQSGAVYRTRNYRLDDLASYFSRNFDLEGVNYDLSQLASDINANSIAIASANQSITTIANDQLAQATFQTNLAATFGTFNDQGVLQSLSQSFADQVLQTTASERYANAQFVTNLASSVGTFDADGNLVTMSESFANQALTTTTSDRFATSEFVTNLGSSFGTVAADGTVTISEAFANEVFSTTTSDAYATASQLTELQTQVSNIPVTIRQDDEPAIYNAQNELINPLGSIWVDTNDSNALYILTEDVTQTPSVFWQATSSEALGDLIQSTADLQQTVNTLSTDQSALASKTDTLTAQFGTYDPATDTFTFSATSDYFGEVKTYADTESASAQKLDQLESAIGSLDAQGNLTLTEAFANQVLNTETTTDYAEASFVTNLASSLGTTDAQGNLTISETFANQVLNTETTTDYAEASFVTNLASSLGTTDAEGNLTISEAFANQVLNTETTTDYAESSFVTNLASSLGTTDADGNLTISEAFANSVLNTETTTDYASAQSVTDLGVTVGNNSSSVTTQGEAILDLEGHAEANYSIAVDVNGNVAGMKLLADTENSEIAFTADTFKIYNGTDTTAAFTLDGSQLKLNVPLNGVSGSFSGDISAATGTFTGGININNRFLVNSEGSTTIKAGDTSSRFEIQNDTGGSKYRLFGHKINFNSWAGGTNFDDASNQFSPGFLQFGGVAYMYSGNGTTTTSNHHMTLDVYGGSKKLFLKGDQITLRKSTTTGGSHTTIIEGDLEVQGSVSFSSGASTSDTTYDIRSVTTTGGALLRLTGSDSTTDDVKFASSGSVTVSYTNDNTIQIHGVDTDTNTQRSDEEIRDLVAGFIQAGNNVSVSHDDSGNTFTISSTDTNTQRSDEEIRDVIAPFVVGGTYITVAHDDSANTLTISHSDTSSQASVNNSNGNVIQDVTLDSRGHVTGLASTNLDNRYLRTSVDGQVSGTITATDFILSSDQRLKSDINTYTPQTINIKYRDYLITNGGDRRRVGVIAQELEKEHPEFVTTNPDTGYKAVSYIDMLVAKVAELEERIKQLENGGA